MASYEEFTPPPNLKRNIIIGGTILVLLITMYKSSITIPAGHGGVLFRTFGDGVVIGTTYSEGFTIIAPWNTMVLYEVRQHEVMDKMAVLSSNGLEIILDVSSWYQPNYDDLALLHQKRGVNYLETVVKPAMRSATRSVIGRYNPEEIYSSKRDAIEGEIYEESKKILDDQYVQLNRVLVRDITLPPTIKAAIENKLKQEQSALEYEFKIVKEKKEAERITIAAQGKADANRILNASLTSNILKDKGIEATLELAKSPNTKIVIIGDKDGMPLILGGN